MDVRHEYNTLREQVMRKGWHDHYDPGLAYYRLTTKNPLRISYCSSVNVQKHSHVRSSLEVSKAHIPAVLSGAPWGSDFFTHDETIQMSWDSVSEGSTLALLPHLIV